MICPVSQRETTRMVYRRGHKLCGDCADPNFLRILDLGPSPEVARSLAEYQRYVESCEASWKRLTGAGSPANSQTISPRPAVSSAREVESILESMGRRWSERLPVEPAAIP